jgi:hypothetical protein
MAKSFDKWPVNIIIVTADKDFLQLIALSKRKCFNTVAVMTKQGMQHNQLMLDSDVIWNFSDFMDGLLHVFKKVVV